MRPVVADYLCVLPVAVAWSSSSSVAIRYVLPVLWMTLCLHIMARNRSHHNSVCLTLLNRGQHDHSAPDWGAQSIVMSVSVCLCVFVCLRSYLWNNTCDFAKFLCMLPMAVARSSSDGVVIMVTYFRFSG